jgi:asparagine synthase (glutamine-hydrolysing)
MCGIAGFILSKEEHNQDLELIANKMIHEIKHRGPDDLGSWVDLQKRVGISHCRLSIVDLSSAGHQPMHSQCKRYILSFNGEIYNHLELRQSLEKFLGNQLEWKGHSDTETLLKAIEVYGIETALQQTVGMFAFALWDKTLESLTLARDRFGEKPLYYGFSNKNFVFASELKAIKAFPDFTNLISRDAVVDFLKFNYIPAPLSIYENIFKLKPGHYITFGLENLGENELVSQQYWSLEQTIQNSKNASQLSEGEALNVLDQTFTQAVTQQMQSDVPLGAFLSGGVDSSLIAATMQKNSMSKIKTFTIGFEDTQYDESNYAKNVAEYLNTEHFNLRVSAEDALNIIPSLPLIYDEPFADSSQIPTYFVCKSAKKYVKVALSGDAGDEIFGGYNRYLWGPRIWKKIDFLPSWMRNALSRPMTALSPTSLDKILNFMPILLPGQKIHKLSHAIKETHSILDLYNNLVSQWHNEQLVKGASKTLEYENTQLLLNQDFTKYDSALQMMHMDTRTYLPDDILCKVDRAAMSMGLETRAPFLDHRLVEFSWQLPLSMKINGNQTKWILRELLYKDVPKNLIERPKAGFSIPLGAWLRGPLREWAENLLDETRLEQEGLLHSKPIRLAWSQHLSKKYDHSAKLWSILMLQSWLEAQG